mmetsp:Transcript_78838/g.231363  ORF Transcript_78838/g.231363 Transcript_78838/m.231363 type:complete len:348 (+) Transcript_78838:163-1206(+)
MRERGGDDPRTVWLAHAPAASAREEGTAPVPPCSHMPVPGKRASSRGRGRQARGYGGNTPHPHSVQVYTAARDAANARAGVEGTPPVPTQFRYARLPLSAATACKATTRPAQPKGSRRLQKLSSNARTTTANHRANSSSAAGVGTAEAANVVKAGAEVDAPEARVRDDRREDLRLEARGAGLGRKGNRAWPTPLHGARVAGEQADACRLTDSVASGLVELGGLREAVLRGAMVTELAAQRGGHHVEETDVVVVALGTRDGDAHPHCPQRGRGVVAVRLHSHAEGALDLASDVGRRSPLQRVKRSGSENMGQLWKLGMIRMGTVAIFSQLTSEPGRKASGRLDGRIAS